LWWRRGGGSFFCLLEAVVKVAEVSVFAPLFEIVEVITTEFVILVILVILVVTLIVTSLGGSISALAGRDGALRVCQTRA
jgi:hypothetical protein